MESENSELQFLDFRDLSEEEVKKIKDILKSVNKAAHVELPWDTAGDEDTVPEGVSDIHNVYAASTLQPLHSQSVSTVPIPPDPGVFPAGGYQVTGSLSHTDSLSINSNLPVSSPPFVPQTGNLPPVTNVSHYPQGFPFDVRTLAFPYPAAATHLGMPLMRPVNQPGSQDIGVYQTNVTLPSYPAASYSSDGMCQSDKNSDAKTDESMDVKQKRLSGDKRKSRRSTRGGRTHMPSPFYGPDMTTTVDTYGQAAVLSEEPMQVNMQTGTTMDVAQSMASVPTTVTQSLSAASMLPYTIQQTQFTMPSGTMPMPGHTAPAPASTAYATGMPAIPFAQIPPNPQGSMFLVQVPMYPPTVFPGYLQPSATSPVVTSGPTMPNSDAICQSNSACPHGVQETSVPSIGCQDPSCNQTERTTVPVGETDGEPVNEPVAPLKPEDDKPGQEASGSEKLDEQEETDKESHISKDETVINVENPSYDSTDCTNEVEQITTSVSEVRVSDSSSGASQTSTVENLNEKEPPLLSTPTSTAFINTSQQKSWADLFKNNSSTDTRVLNAKTIVPTPVFPPQCNAVGEQEEMTNNNIDGIGQPAAVSPREDKLAKKLGKHLLQFQLNHATRYFQPRGLINRSNWCYINATLQALVACPPLFNLLKSLVPQFVGTKRDKSSTPIVDSLVEFVKHFPQMQPMHSKLRKREELVVGQPFEPESIYHMLNITKSDCAKGRQEDAEEFLSFVLNGLHEEMYAVIQTVQDDEQKCNGDLTTNGHGDDSGDEGVWRLMGRKNKSMLTRSANLNPSPISRIFGGQMRSVLKTGGRETSANLQPFFTLQLDIQSEKVESVKEALSQMTAMELIHGYTNSKGESVDAERQITLEELPVVLILHFKWFVYDQDGGCKKLMKKMDYSIDLEIDKDVLSNDVRSKVTQKFRSYKLFAVVYHEGKEAVKGHYVADVYHSGSGGWLRCDDKAITLVQDNQVLKYSSPRVPYLLFYRRLDTAQRNYNSETTTNSV